MKVCFQSIGVRDQLVWVVDYAPKGLAGGVTAIMIDIHDQLVTDALCMSSIANNLCFDNKLVRRK